MVVALALALCAVSQKMRVLYQNKKREKSSVLTGAQFHQILNGVQPKGVDNHDIRFRISDVSAVEDCVRYLLKSFHYTPMRCVFKGSTITKFEVQCKDGESFFWVGFAPADDAAVGKDLDAFVTELRSYIDEDGFIALKGVVDPVIGDIIDNAKGLGTFSKENNLRRFGVSFPSLEESYDERS